MPITTSTFRLAAAAALGLTASLVLGACNGQDALCGRAYSNVTFVGAHNSAFVGELLADNQLLSVPDQLGLGVRFLQAQTHDFLGHIQMCHTSCLERNAGSLRDYLAPVKAFLDDDANANEVVTLLLTNGDAISVSDFADVFTSVGLDEYAFTPPTNGTLAWDQWPSLQQMIDDGTRLVVWMGELTSAWFGYSSASGLQCLLYSHERNMPFDAARARKQESVMDGVDHEG